MTPQEEVRAEIVKVNEEVTQRLLASTEHGHSSLSMHHDEVAVLLGVAVAYLILTEQEGPSGSVTPST